MKATINVVAPSGTQLGNYPHNFNVNDKLSDVIEELRFILKYDIKFNNPTLHPGDKIVIELTEQQKPNHEQ